MLCSFVNLTYTSHSNFSWSSWSLLWGWGLSWDSGLIPFLLCLSTSSLGCKHRSMTPKSFPCSEASEHMFRSTALFGYLADYRYSQATQLLHHLVTNRLKGAQFPSKTHAPISPWLYAFLLVTIPPKYPWPFGVGRHACACVPSISHSSAFGTCHWK